ncbi:hypothetical protein T08_1891 [Trichinella sp. T8]|nr:hypothetical protein T08_1891 [Trichinella sp. T8]
MTLETKITLKQSRQMLALNLTQTQHMAIGNARSLTALTERDFFSKSSPRMN